MVKGLLERVGWGGVGGRGKNPNSKKSERPPVKIFAQTVVVYD